MVINKADMSEISTLRHPPSAVKLVIGCVRTILSNEPTVNLSWAASLPFIRRTSFMRELIEYDVERTPRHFTKALQYLNSEDFNIDFVGRTSRAAKALCIWCRFILVIQRMKQWLKPKQLELEARREASKEAERQTYELMHVHSDIRPVASARRAELLSDGRVGRDDEHSKLVSVENNVPELPLMKAAEGSTLAGIDREIVTLLRLDDASAARSRQVISNLGKSRRTLLKSLGSVAHLEGARHEGEES